MEVQAELATDPQGSTLARLFMWPDKSYDFYQKKINILFLKTESISLIIFSDLHSNQVG